MREGRGAAADFAWDDLARDAGADRAGCLRVAESWNHRSKQEHLAVGGFSRIAHQLAEEGCEPVVLSLVTRAANDEVRHAEICARMWSALRGQPFVVARYRGTPTMPAYEALPPAMRVLLHVVETCCVSETVTGVAFTEMLSRTTHPVARAVVQSLLRDELDHGRVGWAYVAERARAGSLQGLADALPGAVLRAMNPGMKPAETSGDDEPSLERWGYLGPQAVAAIYRSTVREVVLPGFEHFGVDTSKTERALEEKAWT